VTLARNYNRTVVFTIHQPRSNIVALFDSLVLLGSGKLVYAGAYSKCQAYFESIGHPCPPGFNIADFLSENYFCGYVIGRIGTEACFDPVDLTMQDEGPVRPAASEAIPTPLIGAQEEGGDEEVALVSRSRSSVDGTELNGHHQTASASTSIPSTRAVVGLPFISKRVGSFGEDRASSSRAGERIEVLVKAYRESEMDLEGDDQDQGAANGNVAAQDRDVETESAALRGYKRASWWTQFTILSGRAFKNLYRNPMLLLTHYAVSIVLARELFGVVFAHSC
jgi:hypothetical protein